MMADTRGALRSGLYASRSIATPSSGRAAHCEQQRGDKRQAKCRTREKTQEGAHHEHVAVGEVDHGERAVDHAVTERDQRVDAAELQGG
jgi:hypothetical protein